MDNRLQEIAQNIEKYKIGLDDPFKFKCRGCGKCCKNREDVMLTSRDLFRIAQHLEKTPEEIIRNYCDCYIGTDSRFPIIRILPRGVNRACPFLIGKRCQVHAAKPAVCALYPVGRILAVKGAPKESELPEYEAGYIYQPVECGSITKTNTVRQWLEKFGIPVEDDFYSAWNSLLMHISMAMHEIEKHIPAPALLPLENVLVELIYVRYSVGEDFMAQFSKNAREVKELIDSLCKDIPQIEDIQGGENHGE